MLDKALVESNYRINGKQVKAAVQTSPARRTQCASLFRAVECLRTRQVPDSKLEICHRSLSLFTLPEYDLVGKASPAGQWTWKDDALRKLGVDPLEFEADVFGPNST